MKRFIKLFGLALLLTLFIGVGHSYASLTPIGDGGGGGDPGSPYLSTRGPAPNSIAWNPPQQYCNGGIGYNYPCNDTLGKKINPDDSAIIKKSPYFVVGNNTVKDAAGNTTYPHAAISLKIFIEYDPNNTSDEVITVNNASPNCHDPSVKQPAGTTSPDYDYSYDSNAKATKFTLDHSISSSPMNPSFSGSGCDRVAQFNLSSKQVKNSYTASSKYKGGPSGSPFDHYVILTAEAPVASQALQGENSFYLTVDGFGRVGFGASLIGYGYRDTNICDFVDTTGDCNKDGNVFTQAIVFGVDQYCGEDLNASKAGSVQFSDIDAESPFDAQWNPHIHVWLQKENWNNLIISSNGTGRDPNPSWQDVKELTQDDLKNKSDSSKLYQIGPDSFDPGYRYRLLVQNVGAINTVFVRISGQLSQVSGVYHLTGADCLNGLVACQANVVDKNTVNVVITNNAPYAWGKDYQMRQKPDKTYNGVTQTWTITSDLQPGESRHSTLKGLFNRPDNAAESYELYDDTGSGPIDYSPGSNCGVTTGITVKCTVTAADLEPGQTDPHLYTVNVQAKGYGSGAGYNVNMSAIPGAYVDDPTTQPVSIINDPGSSFVPSPPVYFGGHVDYSGTYSATVTDPAGNQVATCPGSSPITPSTRSYFQVPWGGIATGGAFRDTNNNCASDASGNPPYVTPVGNSQYYGGVQAFYDGPGNLGSKVQHYGDILGNIFYNTGAYMGFGATPQASGPSFGAIAASPSAAGNGGYLNSNSANHCVNDMFTNTRINASPPNLGGNTVNGKPTGQYTLNAAVFNGGTINAGHQITLYVNGDVTIKNNVTYNQAGWDATDRSSIPYFMMIVSGNVYIDPSVTQLDGLYVAQPIANGTKGQFHTCDTGGHYCTQQLVVNGAVIAQAVKLERVHGTLHGGAAVAGQPAEIFNYSPLLILGEPYIKQTQPSQQFLEGLFSLPPVF